LDRRAMDPLRNPRSAASQVGAAEPD
jgi:hypothetical protein